MVSGETITAGRRWGAPEWTAGAAVGACAALAASIGSPWAAAALLGAVLTAAFAWWAMGGAGRWIVAFCAATLLLPPLPIELGDSGPHLALAVAAIGLWHGLARLGEWRFERSALGVSLAALVLALGASVGWSLFYSGASVAAGSLARVGLFSIGAYVFAFVAAGPARREASRDPIKWVCWIFWLGLASALFACVDFLLQLPPVAGFGEQYVWLPTGIFRRAQGVFYEAGVLGNVCAFLLVITAAAWFRPEVGRRVASRGALLLGAAVFSAALLFSFSRAALLNALAGLAALAWLERKRLRVGRSLLFAAAALAGGVALSHLLFPAFVATYLERIWATVTSLGSSPETLLSGRLETWNRLLAFMAEQPHHLLLGIGYKTLPYTAYLGQPLIADNMYLALLVETGVLGVGALLALLAAIFAASWRAAQSSIPERAFFGVCVFGFWCGEALQMLAADVLTYWRALPLYFLFLGLMEALPDVRKIGRHDEGSNY